MITIVNIIISKNNRMHQKKAVDRALLNKLPEHFTVKWR